MTETLPSYHLLINKHLLCPPHASLIIIAIVVIGSLLFNQNITCISYVMWYD